MEVDRAEADLAVGARVAEVLEVVVPAAVDLAAVVEVVGVVEEAAAAAAVAVAEGEAVAVVVDLAASEISVTSSPISPMAHSSGPVETASSTPHHSL